MIENEWMDGQFLIVRKAFERAVSPPKSQKNPMLLNIILNILFYKVPL